MYYRPKWVCGRYDRDKNVAIAYNLIEGMSYFFEDYSALVIGYLLSLERNSPISLESLSQKSNISIESLSPFLSELTDLGLVTNVLATDEMIDEYRRRVSFVRCSKFQEEARDDDKRFPLDVTSAEMAYTSAVGGITSVMFELTYNCSERCIHCYNIGATRNDDEISQRGNRIELSLSDYYHVIDELYEQGLIKVCLSGGDPFSKPHIWDIIDYLYNKGIVFDIFTNGQRLLHDINRLANYYPRTVGISIYSGIAKDHDFITRINGSWNKSMSVVQQLSQLAVPLNLKCCIMRPNVKSYHTVLDLARRYGAIAQFEVNLTDSIEGDKCVSKYLRLSPDLMEIVLLDKNIPLYVGKEVPNYGGQSRPLNENVCGAGYNSFCITPEGNLIPCCAFHLSFGNLKVNSLMEILSGNKRLKEWRNLTLSQYEECGKHEYCDYCNLCPGNNFSEHNTPIKAGENNCYMAKIRYALAEKLKEGFDFLQGKSVQQKLQEWPDYEKVVLKREFSRESK